MRPKQPSERGAGRFDGRSRDFRHQERQLSEVVNPSGGEGM